jgi:hypothetical protein
MEISRGDSRRWARMSGIVTLAECSARNRCATEAAQEVGLGGRILSGESAEAGGWVVAGLGPEDSPCCRGKNQSS